MINKIIFRNAEHYHITPYADVLAQDPYGDVYLTYYSPENKIFSVQEKGDTLEGWKFAELEYEYEI